MNRITLIILALFIYNISFAQKGLFIKPYVGAGIANTLPGKETQKHYALTGNLGVILFL